jgi:hypothetical protein
LLVGKLSTMNNSSKNLKFPGGAEVETSPHKKQPDDSYSRPRILPRNRSPKWPIFTVEVRFSEPTRKLEDDANLVVYHNLTEKYASSSLSTCINAQM